MSEQPADPWGWHEPPLVPESDLPPLSLRLAGLADLARSGQPREMARDERFELPSCSELAEVAGLRGEGPAVERVIGWRALGVPAAAAERPQQLLDRMDPSDAGRWLEAGYSFDEIERWLGVDLDTALAFRRAGFDGQEARALVEADPVLSPEEALAFDAAGIASAARLYWVAAGFNAGEAGAYTEADVVASEARVWRASGLGPFDAQAHRAAGGDALPPGEGVGWGAVGPTRDDRTYGVTDPPGTRGATAGQRPPFG